MKIWEFQAKADYHLSIATRLDYFEKRFIGEPLAGNWVEPEIEIVGKSLKLKDFVSWMLMAPVFSEKAVRALERLIGPYVEFFPLIQIRKKQYYAVNVVHLCDCLDTEKTEIKYFDEERTRIMCIWEFHFDESRLDESPIFKVPQYVGTVFVTRPFVDAVIEHGLRGAVFRDPSKDPFGEILHNLESNCVEGIPD